MERGGVALLSQADSHAGWTPLHCALYAGNEALARALAARLGGGDAHAHRVPELRRAVAVPAHGAEQPPVQAERLQPMVAHIGHPHAPGRDSQTPRLVKAARLRALGPEGKRHRTTRVEHGHALVARVRHVQQAVGAARDPVRSAQACGSSVRSGRGIALRKAAQRHAIEVEVLHPVSIVRHKQPVLRQRQAARPDQLPDRAAEAAERLHDLTAGRDHLELVVAVV